MNHNKIYQTFIKNSQFWEKELNKYDNTQLALKENSDSWSIGQLYNHLIQGTLSYHIPQIKKCLTTDINKTKSKNFKGFLALKVLKAFPPIKIKVPASDIYTPKQPKNITELKEGMQQLNNEMESVLKQFNHNNKGKTPHPAFSYLNASEWFQLIPMHFKHHLRQKKDIDTFLEI